MYPSQNDKDVLRQVWRALRENGIDEVMVNYDGEAKDRWCHGPWICLPQNAKVSMENLFVRKHGPTSVWSEASRTWGVREAEEIVPINEAIRRLAETAVKIQHGDWDEDSGASGTVLFNAQEYTITVEHHERVITVKTTRETFTVEPTVLEQMADIPSEKGDDNASR